MIPQIDKEMIEAVKYWWHWDRKIWVDLFILKEHDNRFFKSEMCIED